MSSIARTDPAPWPISHRFAPAALALVTVVVVFLLATARSDSSRQRDLAAGRPAPTRTLPPYWIVRRGNTLTQIAHRTGLTVRRLEALNPRADAHALVVGQRLRLRAHR